MYSIKYLLCVWLLAFLAGCAGSPPPRYVLDPLPATDQGADTGKGVTIGIGKIALPAYLDRLPIARRKGNRVLLDENQRWAEPLTDAVPRVLAANLSVSLPSASFLQQPWTQQNRPDWKLFVRVNRLETVDDLAVELDARWSVLDRGGKVVLNGYSALAEPLPGGGLDSGDLTAVVKAHNAALATLSQKISEDLRGLPAP